jgi:hypothetical protein
MKITVTVERADGYHAADSMEVSDSLDPDSMTMVKESMRLGRLFASLIRTQP